MQTLLTTPGVVTVFRRSKHFPESKAHPTIQKTFPEIEWREMFALWKVFWILERVFSLQAIVTGSSHLRQRTKVQPFWSPRRVENILATKIAANVCDPRSTVMCQATVFMVFLWKVWVRKTFRLKKLRSIFYINYFFHSIFPVTLSSREISRAHTSEDGSFHSSISFFALRFFFSFVPPMSSLLPG